MRPVWTGPSKRKGRVHLDYLQNRKGQTMAAPYCIRPVEGAPVSTPVLWKEVNPKLDPSVFNIKTVFKRIEVTGDLLKGLLYDKTDISSVLQKLAD